MYDQVENLVSTQQPSWRPLSIHMAEFEDIKVHELTHADVRRLALGNVRQDLKS
jgi:hypothetical protein